MFLHVASTHQGDKRVLACGHRCHILRGGVGGDAFQLAWTRQKSDRSQRTVPRYTCCSRQTSKHTKAKLLSQPQPLGLDASLGKKTKHDRMLKTNHRGALTTTWYVNTTAMCLDKKGSKEKGNISFGAQACNSFNKETISCQLFA